jgi:hypothetical protein
VEVDCVRPVGGNMGVSIWIDGRLRALTVSPRVIDSALPAPASDEDRCHLVARHLRRIQRAAADQLLRTDPNAATVFVDETVMLPLREQRRLPFATVGPRLSSSD